MSKVVAECTVFPTRRGQSTNGYPYAKRIPPRAQKVKDELDVYLYRKRKED